MAASNKLPENYEFVRTVLAKHGAGKHLDSNEILTYARRSRARFSSATLYRALRRLADEGLVSELLLPGAPSATYEIADADHAHFQCTVCRTIVDMPFTVGAAALRNLAKRSGVAIETATITFTGRCADCSQHSLTKC